jgi:hypothetical protein
MAKKTKTTKAKPSGTAKPARRAPRPATPASTTAPPQDVAKASATPAAVAHPRAPDPRLPPIGTVIEKRDRAGNVRCTCTIEEGGIRYQGTLYKSLSGAALAAAKDLGLTNRSANGWLFWGLTKVARPAGDPLAALARAWERYRDRAASVIAAVKDDDLERVRELLGEHAEALKDLRGKVA